MTNSAIEANTLSTPSTSTEEAAVVTHTTPTGEVEINTPKTPLENFQYAILSLLS